MIVDLLRNDLSKVAIKGSVEVKDLFRIESYRFVHHMVTDVIAKPLSNLSSLQVFLNVFPSGSITGAPKLEAMKAIHEQEQYARGVYCGSIVYFSEHGRMDSNVAIRTMVASNDSLSLGVGGGIVLDSTWDDEYDECLAKISAIIVH